MLIVGDGRVGKTCLYRSMVGEVFQQDSPSTVGAMEETFEVAKAHVEAHAQSVAQSREPAPREAAPHEAAQQESAPEQSHSRWVRLHGEHRPGLYADALAQMEAMRRLEQPASAAEGVESLLISMQPKNRAPPSAFSPSGSVRASLLASASPGGSAGSAARWLG